MANWFRRTKKPVEQRGLWTRTDGDLLTNDPNQLVWLGGDSLAALLARGSASAEELPVTTRATSLITGPLTSAPFQLVNDATGAALPTPRWIGDPMLCRPDSRLIDGLQAFPHAKRLTRSRFWAEVVRSAIWYGMGAFVYQPDSYGSPLAGTLRQLNPQAVSMNAASRWEIGTGTERVEFDRDGYLYLGGATYRIAVMRNPLSPVGDDGMSLGVFGLSPEAFKTAASVDSFVAGTFTSGVPSGYLKYEREGLTQPQADDLKTAWMANHGGDKRSIAVLNAVTSFVPISFSPVDAEAAAIKRLSVADIAFAFGLPPEVLSVTLGNSATYSNRTDEWQRMKTTGLSLWISELEDVLTALVPYGTSVKVDFSEFEGALSTSDSPQVAQSAPRAPQSAPETQTPAPNPEEPEEIAA